MNSQAETNVGQETLPLLPIKNTVLFPHLFMPLSAGRAGSIAAVEAALTREDKTLVLFTQRDASQDTPGADDLYPVGTRAAVKRVSRSDSGLELLVQGLQRVSLVRVEQTEPFLKAKVQELPLPDDAGVEVEALQRAVFEQAARIVELTRPESGPGLAQLASQIDDPLRLAFMIGSMMGLDVAKEQALLEAPTRLDALRLLFGALSHELQVLELRNKIATDASTEMTQQQREYLLRQQMQAIQKELGEDSPEKAEVVELRKRLDEADLPAEVRKEADRELRRLERLPPAAPDYQVIRTYLEFLLELPWHKASREPIDLVRARQVLDEDHFGLDDIKERILEHLAVLKLNPEAAAPILCFVGPPGVGKTSLGKSIARALGRKFERLSLGGLHDEAELRGHRRTYIGAMPGRILQALRRAGAANPLVMLDEVDKLGRDFRGDPAAALMEILDPAQNSTFRDNYLDLPFDLSGVFFITTANSLDSIPRPLLDRMEILRLPGYSDEEKVEIARRYLLPRRLKEAGLTPEQLQVPDESLRYIMSRYTREAGVRELERSIGRLARKVAKRFAEGRSEPVTVTPDGLAAFLGPEKFRLEMARQHKQPGLATGLAWTEAGGEVLYVEAAVVPDARGVRLTGHLGKVMRESARAAQTYVRAHARKLGVAESVFRHKGVHVHVPAGAVPKDGPSAGVALVTALASAYSGVPARSDTALTGEITLSGLVLPVGGIKEKVLAARRAGIRRVVLPKENEKDLRELPAEVREQLEFIPAERIEQVLAAAIPDLGHRPSRNSLARAG
jgi:ATP-dependent Lon protease